MARHKPGGNKQRVFLVGAGISIPPPASVPAAGPLVGKIVESLAPTPSIAQEVQSLFAPKILKQGGRASPLRFEQMIETIQETIDESLSVFDFLRALREPNEMHLLLADLACRGDVVFTTNFDCFLEEAVLRHQREPRTIAAEKQFAAWRGAQSGGVPIFKLHGSVETFRGAGRERTPETLGATIKAITKDAASPTLPPGKLRVLQSLIKGADLIVAGYSGSDDFDITPALAGSEPASVTWVEHDGSAKKPSDAMRQLRTTLAGRALTDMSERDAMFATWLKQGRKFRYLRARTNDFLRALSRPVTGLTKPAGGMTASTVVDQHFKVWGRRMLLSRAERYYVSGELFFRTARYRWASRCLSRALRLRSTPDLRRRIAISLARTLIERADYKKARALLARIRCPATNRAQFVRLLHDRGFVAYKLREFEKARRHLRQGIKEIDHKRPDLAAYLWHDLGIIHQELGEYAEASKCFHKGTRYSISAGDPKHQAWGLFHLGTVSYYQGDFARAMDHYRGALAGARKLGDLNHANNCLHGVALIEFLAGNLNAATKVCHECLQLARDTGQEEWTGMDWQHIGVCLLEREWLNSSRACLRRAERLYRGVGDRETLAELLAYRSLLEVACGNWRAARRFSHDSVALCRGKRTAEFMGRSMATAGMILLRTGEPRGARMVRRGIALGKRVPGVLLEIIHDLIRWGGLEIAQYVPLHTLSWCAKKYADLGNHVRARRIEAAIASHASLTRNRRALSKAQASNIGHLAQRSNPRF